jgi:hypothetical protein
MRKSSHQDNLFCVKGKITTSPCGTMATFLAILFATIAGFPAVNHHLSASGSNVPLIFSEAWFSEPLVRNSHHLAGINHERDFLNHGRSV